MVSKIIDNIADATFLTSNRMGFMGNLSNIANKTLMQVSNWFQSNCLLTNEDKTQNIILCVRHRNANF